MVQAQTVEEYNNVKTAVEQARARADELNSIARKERSNMLQISSAEKVALVYGENYEIMVRALGIINFRGEIVVARTQAELKARLTSGEQFDVVINTTSDDIKSILNSLKIVIPLVDGLTSNNNLLNPSRCLRVTEGEKRGDFEYKRNIDNVEWSYFSGDVPDGLPHESGDTGDVDGAYFFYMGSGVMGTPLGLVPEVPPYARYLMMLFFWRRVQGF